MSMKKMKTAGLVLLLGMLTALSAQATIIYDFINNSDAEVMTGGPGNSWAVSDENGTRTLTTVDVIGTDGSSALDGSNNTVNVESYNSVSIRSWDGSGQSSGIDYGEAWVISFDGDVKLTEIEFESQSEGSQVTLSSAAFDDIVSTDTTLPSRWSLDVEVSGGTSIVIENTGDIDDGWRIESITVEVIPEPGTLGLISACAFGAFFIRRFRL